MCGTGKDLVESNKVPIEFNVFWANFLKNKSNTWHYKAWQKAGYEKVKNGTLLDNFIFLCLTGCHFHGWEMVN